MFLRLSADPRLIHDYGAACAAHATELRQAASSLTTTVVGSQAMFGAVGLRFLAALEAATLAEAGGITRLSSAVAAGTAAASGSANAYEIADDNAATRIGP